MISIDSITRSVRRRPPVQMKIYDTIRSLSCLCYCLFPPHKQVLRVSYQCVFPCIVQISTRQQHTPLTTCTPQHTHTTHHFNPLRTIDWYLTRYEQYNKMVDRQNRVGSKFGGGGVSSAQQSERERKERLRELALETIDLAKWVRDMLFVPCWCLLNYYYKWHCGR